jgi:ubiquinone/menaquinone biosynthesis C-methylase UbiE
MDFTSRYAGTLDHVRAQWPTYYLLYGAGSLALIVILVLSLSRQWYSFVILALAALMVLFYFLAVSLWSCHALYDNNSVRDAMFELGELNAESSIVDVNLGLREFPASLCRRLTTGKIIAVDVYNPQLTPARALARAHNQAERPIPDPRLSWRDGSIGLLPLPDNSVQSVTLVQTTSELWQEGDRLQLLREVKRVLSPGGCLLMAERVQTPVNLAVSGPAGLRRRPASYWLDLLQLCGFKHAGDRSIRDLILCIRADKPSPDEAKPLPVDD